MGTPGIHEQSAAYTMHALSADEARDFEEHLRTCTVCMAELDSLRIAAAALAFASDGPRPRPELRTRLLEQTRTGHAPTPRAPLRSRVLVSAAAAAAAAAAIALGLWASSLQGSLARERAARAAEARAVAVLTSSSTRRYPLVGTQGTLAVAPDGEAVLVVSRLHKAPSGKSYEAWVVAGGESQPAGVFSGGGRTTLTLTRRVPPGARVAVSLERAGGATRLTGTLLFGAQTA